MSAAVKRQPVRGRISVDEPMARHCSWRTGGAAARYFEPADSDDLRDWLRACPSGETLVWLGLGSNLLVRDGGIDGTVIATARSLTGFAWLDAARLEVACGVTCAKVAKEAAKRGFNGGAFFAGIPGTMGGALAMNAGAFGGETWSLVESAELIDRRGMRRRVTSSDMDIAYRHVALPADEFFISAVLRFDAAAAADTGAIRELLNRRNATQPTGRASCGSVFRNPPGDFAGRLIESAGLKGVRQGGCHVSTKHANFIINDDGASAADIERLIQLVQQRVMAHSGVRLVPEVRIVGEPLRGTEVSR